MDILELGKIFSHNIKKAERSYHFFANAKNIVDSYRNYGNSAKEFKTLRKKLVKIIPELQKGNVLKFPADPHSMPDLSYALADVSRYYYRKISGKSWTNRNTSTPVSRGAELDTDIVIAQNSSKMLFGIELELECGNYGYETLESILNKHLAGLYAITTDGSLSNGYEVLFRPMSHTEWKINSVALYKCLKELRRKGYQSHDRLTCGLHIHVSRAALDDKAISQINCLIHHRVFKDWFLKLSRRMPTQLRWCKFSKQRGSGRYHAFNHKAAKATTVEFRLWRGTLKYKTFKACLETTALMCNLAAKHELTARKFILAARDDKFLSQYYADKCPLPDCIAVVRRKLTDAEKQQRTNEIREKYYRKMNFAYAELSSMRLGMSQPVAFFTASTNPDNIGLMPCKITNMVKSFGKLNFTPIAYFDKTQLYQSYREKQLAEIMITGRSYRRARIVGYQDLAA